MYEVFLPSTDSASDNGDYIRNYINLTFPVHSMDGLTMCLNVTIVMETDKVFTVTLTLITTGVGVTIGNNVTIITIGMDNGGIIESSR